MKKKTLAALALAASLTLGTAFTGCSLVSSNNRLDMEQVVASVDISKSAKFKEGNLQTFASAVASTNVVKRELISSFLNVGYSQVQSGSSYEKVFNDLVDLLVENAVLIQYATVELLKNNPSLLKEFVDETDQVKKYSMLLNDDEIKLATYKLYSSINSALDNFEKQVIDEEDGYKGTGTRTTPTNLNTEQDKYYPATDSDGNTVDYKILGYGVIGYGVYTGYGDYTLKNSGTYKDDALDGTTRSTRVKAYNKFLNNLRRNHLVDGSGEAEKLTDILELDYIKSEFVSQLKSRIINKYFELFENQQEQQLLENNYIANVYGEILSAQRENYDKTVSSFDSAMSGMSSTSFVLYSPQTEKSDWYGKMGPEFAKFGFIYNILLPFGSRQSVQLKALQSIKSADGDDNYYYVQRNALLKDILTEDQRTAWFNGETDYAFEAKNGFEFYNGGKDYRNYLFFEDNLVDGGKDKRYKNLQAYLGKYSYNGRVFKNADESYTLIPEKLSIDDMLDEFQKYVDYALGNSGESSVSLVKTSNYYEQNNFKKSGSDDEIDYSKFIYAEGKIKFDYSSKNLMNAQSAQYKAMSAVNELQFAYTTDAGVLSNYVGYSLTAYDTSYIKEFEYAAKKAVGNGTGSFIVCAGDYGWHLIYVTHVFDAGETYKNLDWSANGNIRVEGTFENLFFEWVKGNDLSDVTTTHKSKLLKDYKNDDSVTKYQSRYQDLLDLGKE